MGRRLRGEKVVKKLHLPPELVTEIDLLFFDPNYGKPEYGACSHLVTALLERCLEERKDLIKRRQDELAGIGDHTGPAASQPTSSPPGELGPYNPHCQAPGGPSDEAALPAVGDQRSGINHGYHPEDDRRPRQAEEEGCLKSAAG